MTNTEMKTLLAQNGVAEKDVEKVAERFNAEKITEIVEAADTIEEAFENIHAFYPALEVAKLQEQMDFVQEQIEAAVNGTNTKTPLELTENELEMVNGGGLFNSIGNWCKKNWKALAITAAVVGAVVLTAGTGCLIAGAAMTMAAPTIGGVAVGATATSLTLGGIGLGFLGAVIGSVGGLALYQGEQK